MFAQAPQSVPSNEVRIRHDLQTLPAVAQPTAVSEVAPGSSIFLRRSSCPCGGGCSACQTVSGDLSVSQPNDAAEIEADRIADSVMRMPAADFDNDRVIGGPGSGMIHRKCNACADADDQDEIVDRKALPTSDGVSAPSGRSLVRDAVSSGGQPLDAETRRFFESRLGYDLGSVRVHTGANAAGSARAIDARAYSLGSDIVFGTGEYDPQSNSGMHLLAHELGHVTQRSGEIRRMTIGSGTPPARWVTDYSARVVPADELDRVNAAIARIQAIVDNPGDYADCIAAFVSRCTGQSPTAFADAFSNAVLWRGDSEGSLARGTVNGSNIFYTRDGYDQGTRGLAQTLVHEMGHNCGVSGADDHYFAEVSANYCVGPQNYIGARFGTAFNAATPFSLAIVYRRLFDLALGGQLQLTVGGDLDVAGIYQAAALAGELPGYETSEFEIASTMAGLRGRFNPWGGEGFGGITLGTEVGLDIGRFRIDRETEPDEFEYGPGFVLQSTLGAEFYIPSNPFIYNFAPEVGYRLVRPLNPEAENIHEFIFGFGGMF